MKEKLRSLIGAVAPTLASALGGPLAGTVVKILADKLGLDTEPEIESTSEKLAKALDQASPDLLLKVKESEQDFLVEMKKLDIDKDKIDQLDRDSARNRQIQTKDQTPNILAYSIVGLFAFSLSMLFFIALQQIEIPDAALRLIDVCFGILLTLVGGVVNYYFGSSAGSKQKTAMLGKPV